MLFGVHEDARPTEVAGRYARQGAVREFTPGVIGPTDLIAECVKACQAAWDAGQTAVWSWKPNPKDVASGAWRKPVEQLAAYLFQKLLYDKTIIVIWHEPENDVPKWFPGGGPDFVRLFNTVHDWLIGTGPVTTCHAALGYRYFDGVKGGITDATAGSWKTKAHINAGDFYSGRSWPLDMILPQMSGYLRWRKYVATGDWALTERGWTCKIADYPKRAASICREFDWLVSLVAKHDEPKFYLPWGTGGSEGDQGLLFDATARAAINDGAARVAAAIATRDALASAAAAVTEHVVSCPLCHGEGRYTFTV